jgi:exosortase
VAVTNKMNSNSTTNSAFSLLPQFLREPKAALQLVIFALCLGVLYFQTFKGMIYDWVHLPDFSYGFFIPLISLYFVWERRNRLHQLPVSPVNSGLLLMLFGLCLFLLGNLASESFTMRISFLFVLSGIVLFVLGFSHLKTLLLPIVYLLFMIPIPSILLQKITFPMQLFASDISELSLKALGVPVFREGNIIHLSSATLQVAEACSGIRSLIIVLAIGTLFAYYGTTIAWKRVVLMLSCFPIAIVINALRVSTTGVLAHYYGISAAEGFFHESSGYLFLLVAFALLFLLGIALSKIPYFSGKS